MGKDLFDGKIKDYFFGNYFWFYRNSKNHPDCKFKTFMIGDQRQYNGHIKHIEAFKIMGIGDIIVFADVVDKIIHGFGKITNKTDKGFVYQVIDTFEIPLLGELLKHKPFNDENHPIRINNKSTIRSGLDIIDKESFDVIKKLGENS